MDSSGLFGMLTEGLIVDRIKKLREQRAQLWEQMKALIEKDSLTGEEAAEYDRLDAEVDRVSGEIDRLERHQARAGDLEGAPDRRGVVAPGTAVVAAGGDGASYEDAFKAWMQLGSLDLEPEQRAVLRAQAIDPKTIRGALGIGTTTAGGYMVPQGFRDTLIETTKWFGGVQQVSEVLATDSGQPLPWPTVDDTANVGAILAENTGISQQDVVFGQATLGAYMYTSKLVLASYQLLNDSAIDVEAYLARALGTRIGRIWNQHFTTGTGTAQPLGVQTNAVVGKQGTTGQTTTVIYDDLVDLVYSVDPSYRLSGRARFMSSDSALKAIRKLKDTQGRPLWEPGVQAGQPDSLLGYPLTMNNDLPAMAASVKSILFGDFYSAYVIRIVNDVQMVRLNERYADALQVGFFAFARADATLQQSAAVRAYQNSAT